MANFNYWDDIKKIEPINRDLGCGAGRGDIKMRYDGRLIYCQNNIFSLSEEDLKDKKGMKYDA